MANQPTGIRMKGNLVATFPIKSASDLADFIIPVTEEMANEIVNAAISRENGYSSAAIYYTDDTGKRQSILISVSVDGGRYSNGETYMFAYCGEYHPRKDGKAEFIYK
jgi:hypothetical protein